MDALAALFSPRSVAVVGASRDADSVGRRIFDDLLAGGFQGPVYPVNPKARHVAGVRAYASVRDVPDEVDLAVIAVPAAVVNAVAEECGQKGVRGLVVISAGFREVGEEGARREAKLIETCRRHGMRMIGPNCMGVMNALPEVSMNATFSPARVRPGRVAFVSQSGALGMAVLEEAERSGLGLSYFASLGNKADVSTNDLLEMWEQDERVGVALLYLENFGNPRNFVEITRRVGKRVAIVALKSGRTEAGARAAGSHTGALAERDVLTEALFEQCGVLRARTIKELFDHGLVLQSCPTPRGNRVGIVTNSGGPAIMATDALEDHGLALARFSDATTRRLRGSLLPEASVSNPVDVIAGGGPEHIGAAVAAVAADEGVDVVLVIDTPPVFIDERAVARAIVEADRRGKPLVACVLGRAMGAAVDVLREASVPAFTFPEDAVRALGALHRRAARAARDPGRLVEPSGMDRALARRIVEEATASGASWLSPLDALALLDAYGLRVARAVEASTPEAAARGAASIGGRVAMKATATGLVHKTEAGGVLLDLAPEDVARAFVSMREAVTKVAGVAWRGVLVQEMAEPGRELILGMQADPRFGPLLAFGLGGIHVEVLRDVAFRLAPLTDADARRMVRAIRGWPLLEGHRGAERADVAAIEDALLRVSALVTDLPAIAEMDVNPLVANERGVVAVDARVRLWPGGEPPRAPAVPAEVRGSREAPLDGVDLAS